LHLWGPQAFFPRSGKAHNSLMAGWAHELQHRYREARCFQGMCERNADIPPEKRIEFRIGINLGGVIVEGVTFSVKRTSMGWQG
jgi:class 3 adenylate cyclase